MDDATEIIIAVEKTWEKDIMPYFYFYLDKNKKQLFVSSLDKG